MHFNKTIIYKEKDDSFYVKDGDGDFTVKEISVKIPHEDKAAIVRVEPYMMKKKGMELIEDRVEKHIGSYEEQMDRLGRVKRWITVDLSDYKLSKKGDCVELRVVFDSHENELDPEITFSIQGSNGSATSQRNWIGF